MLRIIAVMLIALPSLNFSLAQSTGTVTGIVADTKTKEGLIGATVVLKGTAYGSMTGLEGDFSIRGVPTGSYTLKISYIGFGTVEQPLEVRSGTTDVGTILIQEEAGRQKEVAIDRLDWMGPPDPQVQGG